MRTTLKQTNKCGSLIEPTSPTSAKLWNLVSAPCLVFSCLTAHKNKPAPSTKSAILVHINYLYNSKLNWDSFSPLWNCQNAHKDAKPRWNRRQWNCLQTREQTIQKFTYFTWTGMQHFNWNAMNSFNKWLSRTSNECPLCERNMQNVHSENLHTTEVEQYKQGHINRYVTSTEKTSFEAAVIHTGC
jgi:hypothetical protein